RQAVLRLGRTAAEPVDLADERRETVGLVTAEVRDAAQAAGRLGERGEGRDRRGELARGVEVDVEAADAARAGDLERVAHATRARAELLEELGDERSRLRRRRRPARDADGAARDERGREERARVR